MIKDLISGMGDGSVDEIFLIKQSTKAIASSGAPYLSLTLQDSSGVIDGKMWQITDDDVTIASVGHLIRVNGNYLSYKGHPQIKIIDIAPVNENLIDISKYIPVAPKPINEMKEELKNMISMIKDKDLNLLVKTIIEKNYDKYTSYPAAVTVHHAYYGGLLYHSLSISRMCIKAKENYPTLQLDYLLSGALLHDIGKTVELSDSIASSYTQEGNLLGHISIGAIIVYSTGKELGVPSEKLEVLTHMILAHHGQYEYGSPKLPMTPEAYVLHILDDLDAKLECIKGFYEKTEDGSFTERIPWMDNSMFFKEHKL